MTGQQAIVVDEATHAAVAGARPSPGRRAWWRRLRTGDWAIDLACLSVALMGFNRWRVGGFPLSDFVFVGAAAVITVRLLTGRAHTLAPSEARRSSPLVLCAALVLLTMGTLSSFGAWNALGSFGVVLRLAWLTLIWFWILRSVTSDRDVFGRLLGAWRFALLSSAVIATTGELGLTNFTVFNTEGRQSGFFDHPNDLGGFLAVGVPLFALGVPNGDRRSRSALSRLAALGVLGFGLFTTGSMSAIIGAAVGLAATLVVQVITRDPRRAQRRHPVFAMGMVTVVGVGLVLLGTSDLPLVSRITALTEGDAYVNASVESRGERNQYVLDRADELLVVGIGFDLASGGKIAGTPDGPSDVRDVRTHNMYLRLFLEAGLPAVIAHGIIVGTALAQAWRLMVNLRDDSLHAAAAALFGSVVTVNAFAMFQPTLYQRFYWYPIALIGALWALRRQEHRQAERSLAAHGDTLVPPAPA